jgi:hypothetical protein
MLTLAHMPLPDAEAGGLRAAAAALGARVVAIQPTPKALAAVGKSIVGCVFDPALAADFTPEALARLRRTANHPLRQVRMLAVNCPADKRRAYSDAGVDSLPAKHTADALQKAIQNAFSAGRPWVDSIAYVGPCRRTKVQRILKAAQRAHDKEDASLRSVAGVFVRIGKAAESEPLRAEGSAVVDNGDLLKTRVRQLRMAIPGVDAGGVKERQHALDLVNMCIRLAQGHDAAFLRVGEGVRAHLLAAGRTGPINEKRIEAALHAWAISQLHTQL